MKIFWMRTAALFVSICLILSVNMYSVSALRDDLPDADIALFPRVQRKSPTADIQIMTLIILFSTRGLKA